MKDAFKDVFNEVEPKIIEQLSDEFLTNKNKEIVCLSKENLLDLGSIIPLMTRKEK